MLPLDGIMVVALVQCEAGLPATGPIPALGQHTAAVLAGLGMSPADPVSPRGAR